MVVVAGSRLAGWLAGPWVAPLGGLVGAGMLLLLLLLLASMMMVLPAEEPVSPEQRVFPLRDAWSVGSVDITTWCRIVIDAIPAFPRPFPLVGLCYS